MPIPPSCSQRSQCSWPILAGKRPEIVRKALESILGSPLPDLCFLLACLHGMGLQDAVAVLGAAFLSSNFGFASSQAELPGRFWRQLSDAWTNISAKLRLNPSTLGDIEGADSIEPEDIDPAWTKQKWWQEQVQKDAHFQLNAQGCKVIVQGYNPGYNPSGFPPPQKKNQKNRR